jgi:hypothetical protein
VENLVEFDFLRAGHRPPVEGNRPPADYYVIVSRASDYPATRISPLMVRDPIPPIPVPLHPQDEAILLPIRPSMDRDYDEGRLDEEIDYTQPPMPPLTEPDATWARELLAARASTSS